MSGMHEKPKDRQLPLIPAKYQFTKIIVAIVLLMYTGIVAAAIILMAIIQDLAPLPYLITTHGAAVTFVVKYYCKKEGTYNTLRLKEEFKMKLKDEDFNFNQGVDNDDQLEGETF